MSEILPLFKDMKNQNTKIDKMSFNEAKNELFINESLYFRGVSVQVWEKKIGGYQVLDKYLKSHKGENLDISHFENIIKALDKSIKLENEIAKIKLQCFKLIYLITQGSSLFKFKHLCRFKHLFAKFFDKLCPLSCWHFF